MLVSINNLQDTGTRYNVLEFYPGKTTIAPYSYPFHSLNCETIPEASVSTLTYEEYKSALDVFMSNSSNIYIIIGNEETLYIKYLQARKHFHIEGVINIVQATPNLKVESYSEVFSYIPAEGVASKLSIESYMKSLSLVIPNIAVDIYTYTYMYENYCTACGFKVNEGIALDIPYLFQFDNMDSLVEDLVGIINISGLNTETLYENLRNGSIVNDLGFEVFKGLLSTVCNNSAISTETAKEMISYAFESRYKIAYEDAGLNSINGRTDILAAYYPDAVEEVESGASNIKTF